MDHMPSLHRCTRLLQATALLGVALVSTGCAALFGHARLTPQQHWWLVRDSVVVALDSGRYDAAGRSLSSFTAQHPNTPYAADAMFWRALLRLDPRNAGGSTDAAIVFLDSASMMPALAERHAQIAQARRLARQIDDMNRRNAQLTQEIARAREIATGAAAAQRAQGAGDRSESQSNLGDEVRRLREELAKATADRDRANAELQRVRQRLTRPARP